MKDIIADFPGYSLQNLKKIDSFAAICQTLNAKKDLLPWTTGVEMLQPLLDDPSLTPEDTEIYDWLVKNIDVPREHKQSQLYIKGPPNHNKTRLVIWLSKFLQVYTPAHEDFFDGYSDDLYDLVVFDEFSGQRNIQTMNLFLEGAPCILRIKGAQVQKKKNLPVIILSNFLPSETAYQANPTLSAFLTRIKLIELKHPITLPQ